MLELVAPTQTQSQEVSKYNFLDNY